MRSTPLRTGAAGAATTRIHGPWRLWRSGWACLLLFALIGGAWAAAPKRLALVIGNDSYAKIPALANARHDARAMADALGRANYRVTLALDQDQRAMLSTLRNFRQQVEGGDEVVVFFSGHGVQLGAANYLLPVDLSPESEDQVRDEAVPLQRVLDDLAERRARFSLAIIDACRNNPFKSHGRSIGGSRGLAPTSAATGQMVIFSAGTGQEALDSLSERDPVKNGLFTRVFVKEMLVPDVSIDRVLKNVRLQVRDLAASVGREQVPAIYDQVAGDFFFVHGGGAAGGVAATSGRLAPATVASAYNPAPVMAPQPAQVPQAAPTARQAPGSDRPAEDDDLVSIWNQIKSGRSLAEVRRGAASRPAERIEPANARAIPSPAPAVPPMPRIDVAGSATLQRIRDTRTLVVGVRADAPPLSFERAPGRYAGFHVDVCQRLAEELRDGLGLAELQVRMQPVTMHDGVPKVMNGQIDVECGATLNTVRRQQWVAFAPTTYVEEARIVVRSASQIGSMAQLSGKRLLSIEGGPPAALLRQGGDPRLSVEEVGAGDAAQAFMLLEAGLADAMMVDGATASFLIRKSRDPGAWRILEPGLSAEPVALMLARDDAGFKAAVDMAIGRILATDVHRIYAQWFQGGRPTAGVSRVSLAAWAQPSDRPSGSTQR